MAAVGPTGPPPPPRTAGAYLIPPPPPRRERKWLPVLTLLLILLFVVFGGYFVAAGAGVTVPSGQAQTPTWVTVDGVRFRPHPGWALADRSTGPQPGVLLTRGVGNLWVATTSELLMAESALQAYIDEVLLSEATQLQLAEAVEEVPLPGGITALRRAYAGTFVGEPVPLEGDVTAFVLPGGPAVIFDGWAQEGSYQAFAGEVTAMAGTTERR